MKPLAWNKEKNEWLKRNAYVVPYIENQEQRLLKTIYPSRKAKKKYLPKKGVL